METPTESQPEISTDSITKPKVKRQITEEQRKILSERMKAINDKRLADMMAKKIGETKVTPNPPSAHVETKVSPPKKKRIVRVVEVSEDEDSESSESEEEIVIVPKKKAQAKAQAKAKPKAKPKKQPIYESEEEEEQPKLTKRRVSGETPKVPQPEPPKILYRFL
jgi:hypothetical protein